MNLLSTRQKILVARIAHSFVKGWRRLRGAPARAEFTRGGLRWMLDLDEGVDFSIYLLGAFEPDAVRCYEKRLKPGDVVLDIGANIGAHTLPFARLVGPTGRVLAFEPTAYALGKLRTNLALNPELVPRVTLEQTLLMDKLDATVPAAICSSWPLVHDEGLHPDHLGKPHSTAGARSSTLDAVVADASLDRIAFVKLDVDGHELVVLKGAVATLGRFRPPILIELCPQVCVEHGYPFSDLVRRLTDLGYRFESFQGRALPDDPAALESLIPSKGGINVLAVPR